MPLLAGGLQLQLSQDLQGWSPSGTVISAAGHITVTPAPGIPQVFPPRETALIPHLRTPFLKMGDRPLLALSSSREGKFPLLEIIFVTPRLLCARKRKPYPCLDCVW